MVRPLYSVIAAATSLGALLTLSSTAHAASYALSNGCSYVTGEDCTSTCSSATVNCSVENTSMCGSQVCSDAGVTDTCTSACATQCNTAPGSFSCTDYCSAQCSGGCSAHNNCGAASSADCVTDCSAQCSYQCTQAPATTVCATACATSCMAVDNIECTVMCQVTNSTNCTTTPALCTKDCTATVTGGAIVCNGEVVDAEASFTDAVSWYVAHLDATFSASASLTASIGGSTTTTTTTDGGTTTTTTSTKCSASPISSNTGSGGFLLGGLSLVGLAFVRRRNQRS